MLTRLDYHDLTAGLNPFTFLKYLKNESESKTVLTLTELIPSWSVMALLWFGDMRPEGSDPVFIGTVNDYVAGLRAGVQPAVKGLSSRR